MMNHHVQSPHRQNMQCQLHFLLSSLYQGKDLRNYANFLRSLTRMNDPVSCDSAHCVIKKCCQIFSNTMHSTFTTLNGISRASLVAFLYFLISLFIVIPGIQWGIYLTGIRCSGNKSKHINLSTHVLGRHL